MFSQSQINNMSIIDLVETIRKLTHSLDKCIDQPYQAIDYCQAIEILSNELTVRVENYMHEVDA